MSKQDRQGVRTPADLERKYTFADISKTKVTSANTSSQVVWLGEKVELHDADIAASNKTAKAAAASAAAAIAGLEQKVDVSAIVDNLTTQDATKVLSAKQGAALRRMIESASGGGEGEGGMSYDIGVGLKVTDNILSVDSATDFNGDNTRPVEAAFMQQQIGNIEILLQTI